MKNTIKKSIISILISSFLLVSSNAINAKPNNKTKKTYNVKKTKKNNYRRNQLQAKNIITEPQAIINNNKEVTGDILTLINSSKKDGAQDLIMNALSFLGIKYKYGGTNPSNGLDCSGFIQYVFREALGLNLPRTSREMAKIGTEIPLDQLQPGDLIFFNTLRRGISHVAIYIGNNNFIHAPRTGKSIEIASLNNSWEKKIVVIKRVSDLARN